MRLSRVISALALAPAVVVAQAPDGPRGLLPPNHAACRAWQHAWAEGEDAPGLMGYGSVLASEGAAVEVPAPAPGVTSSSYRRGTPLRFGDAGYERLALGVDYEGARGPVIWGGAPLSMPTAVDPEGPGVRGRGEISFGRWVAAVDVSMYRHEVRWRAAAVGVSTRPVNLLAGRLSVRSGPGCSSGLVLSGSPRAGMYGLELRQGSPLRLPLVGATRLGIQVGAMPEGSPDNRWPLFHSMRIEVQPHEDWVVGLNRAAMFGGSGSSIDVTPGSVAWMLIGLTSAPGKDSSFENQIASVDVRGRLDLHGRPMFVTLEHATDDSGWGFLRAPALRAASEVRLSPDFGWVGASFTWMDTGGGWYRNHWFEWGWTERGRLMGNHLGGEGWSAIGSYRRETRSVALGFDAGVVSRGGRNLFAPALEGRAAYGSGQLSWLTDRWEASVSAEADVGRTVAARWSVSVLRRFGLE